MYQKSAKKRAKQDRALEVESILSSQQLAEDNVEYICFKILKLKTLYKLSIMLILFKITTARILILKNYL